MLYIQSEKPHEGGFAKSQSVCYTITSQTEIMEKICKEIQLLVKDSKYFEQQYDIVLAYYRKLIKDVPY